jgi:maleate isomerase
MTANHLPTLPAPSFRLGVLVPPANPTVEIEYPVLVPEGVALHAMRLPVIPGDLDARNRGYVSAYAEAIQGFGSLKLDAIAVAMTGPQYRLLHQGDIDLCKQLSDAAGVRVETASIALCHALQALGVSRLSLLSPYPDWLTTLATGYWQSAGFQVDHIQSFEDKLVAYAVTPDQVAQALRETRSEAGGAVVMSGTGMRTLEALLQVQAEAPTLSSNLCSVWSLARHFGNTPPSPWMRATLPAALL